VRGAVRRGGKQGTTSCSDPRRKQSRTNNLSESLVYMKKKPSANATPCPQDARASPWRRSAFGFDDDDYRVCTLYVSCAEEGSGHVRSSYPPLVLDQLLTLCYGFWLKFLPHKCCDRLTIQGYGQIYISRRNKYSKGLSIAA
jgi:hypothetical protein